MRSIELRSCSTESFASQHVSGARSRVIARDAREEPARVAATSGTNAVGAAGSRDLRVAFVINGSEDHGVVRASRILADALGRIDGCGVTVVRSVDPAIGPEAVREFLPTLNQADIVVIHGSCRTNDLWGSPDERTDAIADFCRRLRPPVVMYLHDLYGETRRTSLAKAARRCLRSIRDPRQLLTSGMRFIGELIGRATGSEWSYVRGVDARVAAFLVSNEIEQQRLQRHKVMHAVEIVPHFIEGRSSLVDKAAAKQRLGLADRLVVTVLGFIHARKGHDLALSMLPMLPENALLVFAGRATDDDSPFYQGILERIEATEMRNRVIVTGYMEDERLDLYLSATDVAICPFREVSASGSLSTWLAAAKPIVASDLPLFRVYNSEFGNAIRLAPMGDPADFARLVKLASDGAADNEAVMRLLAERYSPENTARRLLARLEAILARASIAG
jgi:glycosyltransferase involved in cell wall biosynthesis